MRKIHLILSILGLLITACSSTTLFPAAPTVFVPPSAPAETHPAPTSLPTETLPAPTSQPINTLVPTSMLTETLAFTPTPTLLMMTSSPAATLPSLAVTGTVPTGTMVLSMPITSTPTSIQPTPQGPVFQSVTTSDSQMNWGDACNSTPITFTAQVEDGYGVTSVLLFIHLQSRSGDVISEGAKPFIMHNDGLGTYTYDVMPQVIPYYQQYNSAWVQYQLVAVNLSLQTVGRT